MGLPRSRHLPRSICKSPSPVRSSKALLDPSTCLEGLSPSEIYMQESISGPLLKSFASETVTFVSQILQHHSRINATRALRVVLLVLRMLVVLLVLRMLLVLVVLLV